MAKTRIKAGGGKLDTRWVERVIKGVANHRRIQILELLGRSPELSVEEISEATKIGYPTASSHIAKLTIAGLVIKRNEGQAVRHKLSDRGAATLKFLMTLK
jgi:DNA-binding transcriptional ArsR family regulator